MPMSALERTRKYRDKKKALEEIKKPKKTKTNIERNTRSRRKAIEGVLKTSALDNVVNSSSTTSRITQPPSVSTNNSLNPIQSTSSFTKQPETISLNMPKHPANIPRVVVNPFNMDARTRSAAATATSTINYRPQPNQQAYQQSYQQNASQMYQHVPRCMTPSNIVYNYPVHPDVEYAKLPFYDPIAVLVKPSTLMPKSNGRKQECSFFFHLTPQQATDIAQSFEQWVGGQAEYVKQIQMRFCLMETTCLQDDFFPPELSVKVNARTCPLPNPAPSKQPGTAPKRPPRPLNITQFIKLTPTAPNIIHVEWLHEFGRVYAVTVAVVHKRTASELLARMKGRGVKHSDITRGIIMEKLVEDPDNEIATTSLRVSLMCPLGKMRMTNPCCAKSCRHLQCFDASLFLQMNERKPSWLCPVCNKPILFEDLYIDGYFQRVLNSPEVSTDINEIQLHKDGSWSIQSDSTSAPLAKPVQISTAIDDCIEIIDDDYNQSCTSPAVTKEGLKEEMDEAAASARPALVVENSVVDLTLSDSEDDEPLSKILAMMAKAKPDSTNNSSDAISISSSSNPSREAPVPPAPSSISSSGYPVSSSGVISLDSPSPPSSPVSQTALASTDSLSQLASFLVANEAMDNTTQSSVLSPTMPLLDPESYPHLSPSMSDFY